MYIPRSFAIDDPTQIRAFIRRYGFATLVTTSQGIPFASHLPLVYESDADDCSTLVGHLARANPHPAAFDGQTTALAIFHGPHAYISPTMYVGPINVPTWNYATVHVTGRPQVITDPLESRGVLLRLVDYYERNRDPAWNGALPEETRRQLEAAIVAFRLPIERVEAKFKLGQNRTPEDRAAMIDALGRDDGGDEQALVAFIRAQTGA